MNNILSGKRILYGVTGSIAAFKAPLIIRELVKANAEINVVMTPSAVNFVTPVTMSNVSRNKVIIEQFDSETQKGGAWHILLAHSCDAMLIAPCSASTIGKIANGICDNALTSLSMALPKGTPLIIAPAMDTSMWLNPATQKNIELLKEYGYHIIPPAKGDLSSGLTGEGRLPETQVIIDSLINILSSEDINTNEKDINIIEDIKSEKINIEHNDYSTKEFSSEIKNEKEYKQKLEEALNKKIPSLQEIVDKDKWTAEYEFTKMKNDMYGYNTQPSLLNGKKVLITAGPTIEKIDDVRYISNYSSGKMGFELAKQAKLLGADVHLISGPVALNKIDGVNHIDVQSAEEMYNEAMKLFPNADICILSAAVADFTPIQSYQGKIKKAEYPDKLTIELKPTKDILATMGNEKNQNQKVIGFALESINEIEYGWKKLKEKNCDMIIVNSSNKPKSGFGADDNTITILTRDGKEVSYPPMSKELCSNVIFEKIIEILK